MHVGQTALILRDLKSCHGGLTMSAKKDGQDICDHVFQSAPRWENGYVLGGLGETLEKRVVCEACGVEGKEVWIYSCTVDLQGNVV